MGAIRDRATIFPQRLELRVPAGTVERLDAIAQAQSRTPAELVRQLLLAALADHGVRVQQ